MASGSPGAGSVVTTGVLEGSGWLEVGTPEGSSGTPGVLAVSPDADVPPVARPGTGAAGGIDARLMITAGMLF